MIPSPGESVNEVTITNWLKKEGEFVKKDEALLEIESEKATLTVVAEHSGILKIEIKAGTEVAVGRIAGSLIEKKENTNIETIPEKQTIASISAAKLMREHDITEVQGTGKNKSITKGDVLQAISMQKEKKVNNNYVESKEQRTDSVVETEQNKILVSKQKEREITKIRISSLRKAIAKRLVEAKNTTAMLSTFNEVDMSAIIECRKKYKETFQEIHSVNLGFMSFFTKACTLAFRDHAVINSSLSDNEILQPNYVDIGIAVSTPKGLMVPVIRNTQQLSLADIEKEVASLARKARTNQISINEMNGGTFTITNGGIFGSMLSTPIINPPQSAILGMHNIVERAVVRNDKIVIRPIMYVALSYDHRIIDGKESISFLVAVKNYLENPIRMLLEV